MEPVRIRESLGSRESARCRESEGSRQSALSREQGNSWEQGFHPWGFSPHCSEFATFAKTVAIRGDFNAVIWNVENTETTA